MNRARQLWDYANKVYGLGKFLRRYRDLRVHPKYSPATILSLIILSIAARVGSLFQIERMGVSGELDRLLDIGKKPSADTLGYALEHADIENLKAYNASIIQKARRNKVHNFGTIRGLRVCAVDGTEPYKTMNPCRAALLWAKRVLSNGKEERYERAVGLSYVGNQPRLLFGLERIKAGEGEVAAATRMIRDTYRRNFRYSDIITADALYAQGPFINKVTDQGKWAVIKVKREDYHIVRDMDGLVGDGAPDIMMKGIRVSGESGVAGSKAIYDVWVWDEEGFTSWESVREPLRCIKVREVRRVMEWPRTISTTETEYYLATTAPKSLIKAEVVWEIGHRRWDIENTVFCDLKQNWGFRPCYTHDRAGIEAIYALYCIVFNLMLLFVYRDLKNAPARGVTLKEIARQILVGIMMLSEPLPMARGKPG